MELATKLKILSDSAKYDVSCSSSGSSRKNRGGVGSGYIGGICHSWSADGRCISLLKVLFTNNCMYDCAYCVNRASNNVPRASFTPDELVNLTINFYRRNYIEGLFLSSAVFKSPDYTMELIIKTIKKLRLQYNYNGYIHVKGIPGADPKLIYEAGKYADRMSVNIELPSEKSLKLLAPQKNKQDIIRPMNFLHKQIIQTKDEIKHFTSAPSFVPAGQTTQLIVGATPHHDISILRLSESLYKHFSLKRVYYSAYIPVNNHPNLPALFTAPPLTREHRLYQADWLLRFYGFSSNELLNENHPDFDTELDPKCDWALHNLHLFPVEINKANYKMLLRVPGIAVKSAKRIIAARRFGSLNYENLKKLRVVLKRAKYFITCKGKFYGEIDIDNSKIRDKLIKPKNDMQQLSIFSLYSNII